MFKKVYAVLLAVIVLSACNPGETKKGGGKFGMLDSNIPESTAIEFFDHIYHDKNIEGALKLSTPKMQRLLRSYHTNKGVQKHIFNMRFDKVAIQPSTRSAGRNEYAKDAKIALFFEGELNGDIFKDMRVVELLRIDDQWRVDVVSLE
ncbi:hypothetical protein [Paraglaciecola sp. 2405UD69-4]|uniref:hypothetical protein n=1 Tax=Paraglaciecola sp. 2405UD69-4 TaxID=3391836 RepID=UPI0039C92BF0